MVRYVNPLLRDIIYRMSNDSVAKNQCLQYLKALRRFQHDGHETIFFGETNIPESLITGEKLHQREILKYPTWSVVHAGGSQGWVPWKYRLFLRDELQMHPQEDIFHELCASLSENYGKCVIVMRDRKQPHSLWTKGEAANESNINEPSAEVVLDLANIKCTSQAAREYGHELLCLPPSYSYLYPLDTAWSTLKWFIINNRREFSLISSQSYGSYQYILLCDLIGRGIEKMTPFKWKVMTNKVRRWENHYLHKFS
ncbi:uncharacterized protein C21orf140 homolog [Ambystoma mexicanum]|uniref:uncharacterized protein C21orf140 homolog n=1 Tax=Ambystoma mexicanum TaxID=8296 RepID=UPI0037E78734